MAYSKEYWQQYYQKNRERRRQQAKEYYQRTRVERYAKHKERRLSDPEAYAREKEMQRARYRINKENPEYMARRREIAKKHYWKHRDRFRDPKWDAKFRAKKAAIVERAKLGKSCSCGESDPICLDFHHRDPSTKVGNISRMASKCVSDEKLLAEIAKCDLICSNCHRKLHRDGGY